MTRPLLLGHRGSPLEHRENTLASFQAALIAGLDGVELDVRRASDGTLVVHHDEQLFDGRHISRLTFPELRPHPVPTLAGVLAWAADAGAFVNVELKYESLRPDDRVAGAADLLRFHGLLRRSVVSSFNPLFLAPLPKGVERGLLFDRATPLMLRIARRLNVAAIHPHFSLVTPELIGAAKKQGWNVNVWNVNEEALARELLSQGANGLIGNLPRVLLAAADRNLTPA